MTTSLTYKLPPRFTISVSTNQTFARLPEGDFIARIFTSNVNYAASPSLSFSNLIQYDNRSRNLGWQSRVRWTLQPGNDLFFAFNQGWIQEEAAATSVSGRRTARYPRSFSTRFAFEREQGAPSRSGLGIRPAVACRGTDTSGKLWRGPAEAR